jgi:FtsP/CotA-like multicopper oxidase with cupredoxin domain
MMDWEHWERGEGITRRAALARGLGGLMLLGSFPLDRGRRSLSARAHAAAANPFEPFRVDLPLPPVARPVRTTRTHDEYEVLVRQATAEILPGLKTPIIGYDGVFPGPTFHATRGRKVAVRQINRSGRGMVVHLHGGITQQPSDGHPHDVVPDGKERTYHYASVQRAATLWYHDHSHGEVSRTLYAGLAGLYILRDPDEDALELPQGDYDVPLVITDRSFNEDGSFRYQLDLDMGFHGDTILVNGAVAPRMAVRRRLYRFRILNASNARAYTLVLGNNREMIQIAGDDGLLPQPVKRTQIPISPAERVEIVVDFRQFGAGAEVVLHNPAGEPTTQTVMRFDVIGGGEREQARVPKQLTELEPLPPVNARRSFKLTFRSAGQAQWQINDLGFDMHRVDVRPRLGTTELWSFVNVSPHPHPMHTHLSHFRVISVGGHPPGPADAGWKDVITVPPGQTAVVQPYFDRFPGRFVFHCHTAEHGDNNMMGQMEVVA